MVIKRVTSFASALIISLSSLVLLSPVLTQAVVDACTWTGGGAADNFNDTANWNCATDGAAIPENGDSLVFDASTITAAVTITNDIVGLSVAGVTFTGVNPDYADTFTIAGSNALTLTGNIANNTTAFHKFTLPITLGANVSITSTQIGGVSLGTFASSSTLALSTYSIIFATDVSVYHSTTGSGNITVNASRYVSLYGTSSSNTGTLTVNGHLTVSKSGLGNVSAVTVGDNAVIDFDLYSLTGAQTINTPITLNGDGIPDDQYPSAALYVSHGNDTASVTFGAVTLGASSTIEVYATADQITNITATLGSYTLSALKGSQGVLKINNETIKVEHAVYTYVSPDDDYTGSAYDSEVSDHNKYIYNNQTTDNVTVQKGGIVGGKGKIGNLTLENGSTLAPGESPGCLSSNNLTFVAGSIYEFEVGGATACTQYDQMKVTGTVTLGNGTLNTVLFNGFKPVKDQNYMIIENDAADAVAGTFLNLAEGATFTVSGYVLKISYVGGTGNDVVLTVQTVPTTPDTGFSLLLNNPLQTVLATTLLAAAMLVLAKRYEKVTVRSSAKRK